MFDDVDNPWVNLVTPLDEIIATVDTMLSHLEKKTKVDPWETIERAEALLEKLTAERDIQDDSRPRHAVLPQDFCL